MSYAYVREGAGHALIGARQWIPAEHIRDPAASAVMGLPADLAFRTKGQLTIGLCADAFADGVWFDFVCGDEVYGNSTELREFCEDHGQGYVLRVRSTFHLVLAGGGEAVTCAQAARALGKNTRRWEIRSAGAGSKGQRWYAWAWLDTASPAHHLLIRGRAGGLRRHRRLTARPHRYPGTSTGQARSAASRRPFAPPRDRWCRLRPSHSSAVLTGPTPQC
jgi:SRSO17 transposase